MKTIKILAASALLAPFASAATIIPFDFSDVAVEGTSTFDVSSLGDVWRASNANANLGIDAIFTMTAATANGSPLASSLVFFDSSPTANALRGNNMRLRVGPDVSDARVFITITFVESGTDTPFVSWPVNAQLITQFSDLDSDAGGDRSDFGGVESGTYDQPFSSNDVNPGSSLLVLDSATEPGYDIFRMQEPWGPKGNVIDTDAASQSPVTGAFLFNVTTGEAIAINMVGGQLSNNSEANRHIDIDMTPDFIIIPEPSSALLVVLAGLFGFMRRRR